MTPETLLACMPFAASKVATYAPALTQAMVEYDINSSLKRQAAFLAEVCHESGSLKYTAELADGHDYEGRMDLGNVNPGDGPRFKGRGLLQITGRNNYRSVGVALGELLLERPDLLEAPLLAARSAGWFWKVHGLNELADADRFGAITKRINGAYNGLDERIQHWLRIRKVLGL